MYLTLRISFSAMQTFLYFVCSSPFLACTPSILAPGTTETHAEKFVDWCRFIYAFGGAGVLILLTASTALVGVAHNSAFCLGLFSFLMVLLLLAEAALAIAFFADNSWKKKLPHDDTGEARQVPSCFD